MKFTIEHEREEDGRWLAEVPELPGVLAYGVTADEAMARAEVLALRVLAERLEHGESRAHSLKISVAAALASSLRLKRDVSLPPSPDSGGESLDSPGRIRLWGGAHGD